MAPAKDEGDGGLFGWKHWTFPDEWTVVARDRTEKSPTAGRIEASDPWNDDHPGKDALVPFTDQRNPVRNPQLTIAADLMRGVQPLYKSFFTDMGANLLSNQGGICQDFELRALECIEYYGAKQGMTACKDWYDDFIECQAGAKQKLRMRAMFKKRHFDNHMEYLQGKRTWDETYEKPPKYHAYMEPWADEKYSHIEQPCG